MIWLLFFISAKYRIHISVNGIEHHTFGLKWIETREKQCDINQWHSKAHPEKKSEWTQRQYSTHQCQLDAYLIYLWNSFFIPPLAESARTKMQFKLLTNCNWWFVLIWMLFDLNLPDEFQWKIRRLSNI